MMTPSLTIEERIQYHVARLLLRLPSRLQVSLSRKARIEIDGDVLHPELQLILALREFLKIPGLADLPVLESRLRLRRECIANAGPVIAVGPVKNFTIPGPAGPIAVRHYAPPSQGNSPRPLLVFLHGGGFIFCDLDTHDAPCRLLCKQAGVHVLAIDYRLAPENPFPAGLEDAHAAYLWACRHAAGELGADPHCIALGGDSAGANLATLVAQQAARGGDPKPALQLLIYPTVDGPSDWKSMSFFGDGFFLTKRDIEWCRVRYLNGVNLDDPRLNPLRNLDLAGSAPALVVTASFDPIRDEGEAYHHALRKAGVSSSLVRMPGMIHGFINMMGVSQACHASLVHIAALMAQELNPLEKNKTETSPLT